uniref:Uncharacterized protein n=1 Tax=viral metagenome TaxID=1070528 RepID=A0A6C0C7K8_9ZZZZ
MNLSDVIQLNNGLRFRKLKHDEPVPLSTTIQVFDFGKIDLCGFDRQICGGSKYVRSIKHAHYLPITFDDIIKSVTDFSMIITQKSNLFLECESMGQVQILLKNNYIIGWCDATTLTYIRTFNAAPFVKIMMDMIPYLTETAINKMYDQINGFYFLTLVEYACTIDSVEMLELLLSCGANLNKITIYNHLLHINRGNTMFYLITRHNLDVNHLVESKSLLCQYLQCDHCEVSVIFMLATDITLRINDNVKKIWDHFRNIDEQYELLKILISWGVLYEWSTLHEMHNLKEIYVSGAGIKEIPNLICRLRLEILSLPNNSIETIPDTFFVISLRKLILHDNKIKEVPKSIGKLIFMSTLDLRNNPITKVPRSVKRLDCIKSFSISSTHIKNKSRFIKRCGQIESAMIIDDMTMTDFMHQIEPDNDPYTLPILVDAYGNETRTPGELAIAQCKKSSQPFPKLDRKFIKPSTIKCIINHEQVDKYFHEGIYIEVPVNEPDRKRIECHKLMIHDKELLIKFLNI